MNGRDGAGNTPLILAVHEGLEELVHYLLSVHAADPNVRNHDGLSVIQIAIKCCNIGSLQMLLANSSANMKCKAITVIEFAQSKSSTYSGCMPMSHDYCCLLLKMKEVLMLLKYWQMH